MTGRTPENYREKLRNFQGMQLGQLFVGLLLYITAVSSTKPIQRLNYGVVFQPHLPVHFSTENWLHTYQINIPRKPTLPQIQGCHTGNATCALIRQIQTHLNAVKTRCAARLDATKKLVYNIIPNSKQHVRSRSKRALFNFVGSFSKTLFGTATTNDVNILAKHINALVSHENLVSNNLQQHAKHLSSYMSLVDSRFHNAMKAIKTNHDAIHFATITLNRDVNSLKSSFVALSALLMDQVEQASTIDHQLEELKLGILSLVNDRLSPLLISEETLHQTILHLTKLLSSSRPNFVLLQRDPSFYFSQGQFIYTRAGDRLYVSIKFPISSFGKPLHLYKMISLPVPVNETSLHSTQLISIPSFFAVSEDNQHYVTLSDTQVSTCIGRSILHCPYRISLTPVTVPSCELALFQNNRAQVKQLCDFRYVTKAHPPTLLEIDHSTVLIYRIPTLSLTCPSVQRMIPGCSFCLLKSPCSCALSTESIFFPASFSSCTNSTTHLTRLHPVNLALLQHFFDDSTLSAIAGDTTFKRAISITNIPQFHLYSHNFSHFLARDNQDHLSLKRMVASAKKDETVFQNLAEPLLDGEINIPNSWPDTNALIVIVSTIMSSFSVILVIWLFFKLRSLTTALALLTNVRPIHSLQPPSFDYKQLMPTTSKPDTLFLPDLTEYHVSILLGVLSILLCLIIFTLIFKQKKSNQNCLVLEITTGPDCITIPIIALSLCPSYWTINPPTYIHNLRVTDYFFPSLSLEWPNFCIKNNLTDTFLYLPTEIRLNIFTAKKLRKMLNQPVNTYILLIHGGYIKALDDDMIKPNKALYPNLTIT